MTTEQRLADLGKRRGLDLFSRAGGATRGYELAGFEMDGVDIEPQKHYVGTRFFQADAIKFCQEHGHEYDFIHASPPCQVHSALAHFATPGKHEDLIPQTREALIATGKPYVIENVVGALNALRSPFMLCGTMFLLRTNCGAELRRHRLFETNWWIGLLPCCQHSATLPVIGINGGKAVDQTEYRKNTSRRVVSVCGDTAHDPKLWRREQRGMNRTISIIGDHARDPREERERYRGRIITIAGHQALDAPQYSSKTKVVTVTGSTPQQSVERNVIRETFPVSAAREAMGIDWMPMKDLSQAIPPAYTKWIGEQLMEYLNEL